MNEKATDSPVPKAKTDDDAKAPAADETVPPERRADAAGQAPKRKTRRGKKTAALEQRIEELEAEIERLSAAEAEARERWYRSAAEFENFRRRTTKERAELIRSAGQSVVSKLLEVMDALHAAQGAAESVNGESAAEQLRQGIGLIASKLEAVLASEGVTPIEVEAGADFDPHLHEALARVPAPELPAHAIHSVVQRGYLLGERVLRPARVAVVAEPETGEAAAEDGENQDGVD